MRTAGSPFLTAFKVGKFLLFPRGIKSQFAKEQEAEAAAAALEAARQEELLQLKEHEALIRAWAPGELLLAEPQPEQLALTWDHAADVFDAHCKHVADTAGQPWSPAPPKKRIKAKVAKPKAEPEPIDDEFKDCTDIDLDQILLMEKLAKAEMTGAGWYYVKNDFED